MAKYALAGIGLLFAVAAVSVAQERTVPQLLIVQAMSPVKDDSDPNVPIANFLAQEIEEAGRLSPIVWSLTDPTFRKATLDGKLKALPDKPKESDIMGAAKALGADFVIICQATRTAASVKSNARLLRSGREIWKDNETMRVDSAEGYDSSGTAQSIARTFLLKMTPSIKDLPVKTKVVTPPPEQGQAPEPPPVEPPKPTKTDNTKLKSDVQGLVQTKQYSLAIAMLRDAIDIDPLDAERRTMLIDLLRQSDAAAAASEAARAGDLLPDKAEFRILEARAWMQAGRTKEAQEALNEAIARAPEATTTRLLLAELALNQGDPEKALPHLDQTIKNDPNAEAFFLRALCRSLLGGADGAKLDLAEMAKTKEAKPTPLDVQRRYSLAISILDKWLVKSEDSTRTLISRAIVKPKDAEVRDGVAEAQRLVAARIAFLTALPHPAESQKTFDRWLLAHRLMAQSLMDVQNFMAGDSEALTDARLNLGEAIKQSATAREDTSK